MANIEDNRFRRSNPIMRFTFRHALKTNWVNRYFYNLQGHADYKRRFGGVEKKCYLASPYFVNDIRLVAILRLCRIL